MIIDMMRERREPRSLKLRHWYRLAIALADECQVATWTHHFRAHNTMADRLANLPMDTKQSRQMAALSNEHHDYRFPGLQAHLDNDVTMWTNTTNDTLGAPSGGQ
jgi:hypothetical protein